VLTYRSTRGDDASMRWLQDSGHFLFFDLETITIQTAQSYLRCFREFEQWAYDGENRVLPAPPGYQPATPDEVDSECALLGRLASLHMDREGEPLISRPLLMHLVAQLGRGRLARVRSLTDLYEQVVDAHIARDLDGPLRSPRLKDGTTGPILVRTAMTRVALAMQARGEDVFRIGGVQQLTDLLTRPEDGKPGGEGALTWWSENPEWTGPADRLVPYYGECFRNKDSDPEVEELLEFGLLRRAEDGIGFLHDSFLDYFLGVYALDTIEARCFPEESFPG